MPEAALFKKPSDDVWRGFQFRQGDIVISTTPKNGTTWMQMICALLVFQTPDLPAPLSELAPWIDAPGQERRAEALTQLSAQRHRRIIKTHTPLNLIPQDPGVTYVTVVRHPLDALVSGANHQKNLDHQEMLRRQSVPVTERRMPPRLPPLKTLLMSWIDSGNETDRGSLLNVIRYLSYVWGRRNEPNFILVHYGDLSADLESEMRRIAERLKIAVPEHTWPKLVEAATFEQMRSRADRLVPDPAMFRSAEGFFHRGTSGAAREVLADPELDRYYARVAGLAPPDLFRWLHREEGERFGGRAARRRAVGEDRDPGI
jgi:aryl sulfotransferase